MVGHGRAGQRASRTLARLYAIPTRASSPRHLDDRLTVMRQRLCRPAHIRVTDRRQDLTPAMPHHVPIDKSFHIRSMRRNTETPVTKDSGREYGTPPLSTLALVNLLAAALIAIGMYWPFPDLGASLTVGRPLLLVAPFVLALCAFASFIPSRRAVVLSTFFDGSALGFGLSLIFSVVAPDESVTLTTQAWLAAVVLCLAGALFVAARLDKAESSGGQPDASD
jgi:hypothetical protein